ncbi:hypothetical protein DPMN_056453 [Dreissena polymorpha]|uniref:Uncharacterized protein n=1 Tax=Dreissena polymorpha TaxID=45954 RepID=A0A9D4HTM1_DREPO|nr:hypothetical protein DPMN_056453 [Dreissena polymorpha]
METARIFPFHVPIKVKVKKKWSDIKSATKTKAMAIKSVVVQTGGGPPPKPLSALQEKVFVYLIGMIYRIFTVLSVLPDCITMGITGGVDTFLTIDKPEGFFEDSDSESYSLISGEKSTDTVMKKKGSTRKGNVTSMMNFWQLREGNWNYLKK